jgi:hypothetical protein
MTSVYKQFSLVILLLIQTVTSDRKLYSKNPIFVQELTKVLQQIATHFYLKYDYLDKHLKMPGT